LHFNKTVRSILTDPSLKNPVFIGAVLIFVSHQIMERVLLIYIPILDSYLDMFTLMPILLTLLTLERRYIFEKPDYSPSLGEVVLASIIIGMITEVLFPMWSDKFTQDFFDLIPLILGAILYYLSIQSKTNHSKIRN